MTSTKFIFGIWKLRMIWPQTMASTLVLRPPGGIYIVYTIYTKYTIYYIHYIISDNCIQRPKMASNGLDLKMTSNQVFQKQPPRGHTSQKMGSVASKMAELWPWTFSAIGLEKLTLAFPFFFEIAPQRTHLPKDGVCSLKDG